MAQLYDDGLTMILDRLIPVRTLRFRRRVSDPWFDDDCRVAKRCVRFFEREALESVGTIQTTLRLRLQRGAVSTVGSSRKSVTRSGR